MSAIIKAAKKVKKILHPSPAFISFSRRINYVKTDKRICAMTFDDGPMLLPASPDSFSGKPLTEILLDTLDKFGAKGTFDIIGTTRYNYPDSAGATGSPSWSGIKYDHYPDFNLDNHGGALFSHKHLRRMIKNGHTLSNHGYRHIIFGKKPFVYGSRVYLNGINEVVDDTVALNDYIWYNLGYKITLGRPPHYVDKIKGGFTSYDAYSFLGMQYMGASYDGGGWLPEGTLEHEIDAMVKPMATLLEKDPDAFCGKIIFQKDGYNMAKRTPVAFALEKQLELLYKYGYTVVGVDKLMEHSRFSDVSPEHPLYSKFCKLSETVPSVFSDNCIKPQKTMTKGELALLLVPRTNKLISSKQMQSEAVSSVFGKKTNPSAPLEESDIKLVKQFFNDMPRSMLRENVIAEIII
ncbi:MAG: hypothetical protein E7588_01170 [Ruminococcaceae bacterium]|nr:hypothetical protein [Oscillospiraceae bacterium]